MAARWPSGDDTCTYARHHLGVRPLLCRHHGGELEIPVYRTDRFRYRDYIVFNCGCVALGEARGLKLSHYPRFFSLDFVYKTYTVEVRSLPPLVNPFVGLS
jgi:hypothetical protein